jgi:signal peptidase I
MTKVKSRSSRRSEEIPKARSATDEIMSYVKSLAIAFLLVLPIKHFIVEGYRVPTGSMKNTILIGDFLMANKFIYGASIPFTDIRLPAIREPRQGDIVIFKFPLDPSLNYVKRCIAGPGQEVQIKDKVVYVDGVRYEDSSFTRFADPQIVPAENGKFSRDNFGPIKVPPDSYFMMGDNRDRSNDSRFWGFVPKKNVLGKAMFLYLSWNEDPSAPSTSPSHPLSYAENILYNFVNFYDRIRWKRLGMPIS